VLIATFHINHFDLFGLRQTFYGLIGRKLPPHRFVTPGLYRVVRHPLYLGFVIAFWEGSDARAAAQATGADATR
jgi:methanethiol S-methyltransferase